MVVININNGAGNPLSADSQADTRKSAKFAKMEKPPSSEATL